MTQTVTEALSGILDTYEMLAYVLYSQDEVSVKRIKMRSIEDKLAKQWQDRRVEMTPKTSTQKTLVSEEMRRKRGQHGQ